MDCEYCGTIGCRFCGSMIGKQLEAQVICPDCGVALIVKGKIVCVEAPLTVGGGVVPLTVDEVPQAEPRSALRAFLKAYEGRVPSIPAITNDGLPSGHLASICYSEGEGDEEI